MSVCASFDELLGIRAKAKAEKRTVVFTNGVFDILHRGHVEYLEAAKRHGDILIVGVNSDASVRRIKGEKKPIVPQDDRMFLLASLACVDYVCGFDEDTPQRIISELLPDVLVKGADYNLEDIVGRAEVVRAGGRVVTIPLTPAKSTTNIIDTIIERYCRDTKS